MWCKMAFLFCRLNMSKMYYNLMIFFQQSFYKTAQKKKI